MRDILHEILEGFKFIANTLDIEYYSRKVKHYSLGL